MAGPGGSCHPARASLAETGRIFYQMTKIWIFFKHHLLILKVDRVMVFKSPQGK